MDDSTYLLALIRVESPDQREEAVRSAYAVPGCIGVTELGKTIEVPDARSR